MLYLRLDHQATTFCGTMARCVSSNYLADGVGFEPTRPLRTCRFSRPVPSTARPPIHAPVHWEDSRLERSHDEISQNRHPPPVCAAAITQEITGKIWPAALGRVHVMAMAK